MEETPSSAVEGYGKTIEEIDDLGSILGDSELAAARQELRQHARGLAEEIDALVSDQLAAIEREEARAVRIVASLQERARSVSERERALSGQQERLRVSEADLEERTRRFEELRSQLAPLEERIAHEEKLKAERAHEGEQLRSRERALSERQADLERRLAEGETESKRIAQARDLQGARAAELERVTALLAEQQLELEQRVKAVEARELLVRRLERPAPAPPSAPGSTFDIDKLERLVAARRQEFPDRIAEWDAYLLELRPQSAPDGVLPGRLTGLIEDIFAPLL